MPRRGPEQEPRRIRWQAIALRLSYQADFPGGFIDIDRLVAAIRRQLPAVFAMVAFTSLLGTAYLLTARPYYTASALILIDNRRIGAVESSYAPNSASGDAASSLIDSQVEVIKAESMAARVIRQLNLVDDPEFKNAGASEGRISKLKRLAASFFGRSAPGPADTAEAKIHWAADLLLRDLEVHRVARTMVLQVAYTSPDAVKAARIANAYADAYLTDQLDAKYEATKAGSHWLEERIADIKSKALASDLAIQKYREEHNLISSSGRLVNEQQLSEVNTQLVTARADVAQAEARYERIDAIIQGRHTEAIVSEAIGNVVIEQLRSKYLDVSRRYAGIEAKLGKDHLAAVNLKDEMREYERLMFEELSRLAEGYRSELEIAESREKSLKGSLEKIVALSASENKSLVTLRELEREAATYRDLRQRYLQRYNEALQQESFPIAEARVIASATTPRKPSYPKKLVILILFAFLGGAGGGAVGFFRELREKGFYSEDQVKSQLALECLGILPAVSMTQSNPPPDKHRAGENCAEEALHQEGADTARANPRYVPANSGILSYSQIRPGSSFAETLLAVKLTADVKLAEKRSKIIGAASLHSGEGKSLFAKNFGSLLASLGSKTLLIDADLRMSKLTKEVAPTASQGLLEALIHRRPLGELTMVEERSGLSVLPCVVPPDMPHSSEFLASNAMKQLLAEAQNHFDYIILDLPPLGPVADTRAIAPLIDAFVFMVEWRATARKAVRNILMSNSEIYSKCLGVVLNNVNVSQLRLYEGPGSRYHYYNEYAKSYCIGA